MISRFIFGLGLGFVTMYVLDPQQGRSRRARLGDKAHHYVLVGQRQFGKRSRDLRNRAYGSYIELRKSMTSSSAAA